MVQETELRIGNYVMDYTGKVIKIQSSYFCGSGYAHNPIPLTHEILEQCGFKLQDDMGYSSDGKERKIYGFKNFYVSFEDNKYFKWNDVEEDTFYSSAWPEIKNLHQLQNLYFALTGTELEVKQLTTA